MVETENPSETYELVSCDDDSQRNGKNTTCSSHHQPDDSVLKSMVTTGDPPFSETPVCIHYRRIMKTIATIISTRLSITTMTIRIRKYDSNTSHSEQRTPPHIQSLPNIGKTKDFHFLL